MVHINPSLLVSISNSSFKKRKEEEEKERNKNKPPLTPEKGIGEGKRRNKK